MKKRIVFSLIFLPLFYLAQNVVGNATINVVVVSNLEVPIENQEILFISAKTKKTYKGISKKDGKMQLFVPTGDTYKVQYQSITSKKDYTEMPVPNSEGVVFTCKLKISPPTRITLDNVFFDTGKSTLKPESFKELDELVRYMMQHKSESIEIAGHTDNVGDAMSNKKLSEDRANAVKYYLQKKGIESTRVVAKGYGDTEPIADNADEKGRKQNRRTEVRVLKK
jgi:OmpA-OmpF porin, OOP family